MRYTRHIQQSIFFSMFLWAALFFLPLTVIHPVQPGLFSAETPIDESNHALPPASEKSDRQITLNVLHGGAVLQMDLGSYLMGVVRAEMPASFESEALKAQAVAARTYTLYKMQSGGNHGSTASICTDPACCQAYLPEEEARRNWGPQADAWAKKTAEAVTGTDGQVILYGGVPILAAFHSSSSGLTRPAGAVWQNDLPYLQAVSSPEATDTIPNYYSRAVFSSKELKDRLLTSFPTADLSGDVNSWLKNAAADSSGNVETLEVGGIPTRGSALRAALGLRSACFEWEIQGDQIVFFVTGYGHGVGLSQYGANRMAAEGHDYQTILTHYYSDVSIGPYLYKPTHSVVE